MKRLKINSPKVIDTQMRLPDASSFTWRTKMATASVYRPTDHVMTNVQDPRVTPVLRSNRPVVYKGTGQGGKVPDATTYTLGLGASALGQDSFNAGRVVLSGGTGVNCLTRPPPSQVVNENGNAEGRDNGLNLGYTETCATFDPLTKTHFVERLPDLRLHKVGIQSREAWNGAAGTQYGSQNAILCSNTAGNWDPKSETTPNLHPVGPKKTDFVTSPVGPQVSRNGLFGRAPKVGGAMQNIRLANQHHGLAKQVNPPPAPFKPPVYPAITHRRM